ncbi:hypothetical protein ACKKBG_A08405 [Auxenochlorella protothecoides x Auxenochlorella symbiontica]
MPTTLLMHSGILYAVRCILALPNCRWSPRQTPLARKVHTRKQDSGYPGRQTPLARARSTSLPASLLPPMSLSVAVIGTGAGGLVTLRELLKEGHQATAFEQAEDVGGVWVYTEETETDPLGRDTGRRQVHSSMYAGLRTNLPREVMGFGHYPFTTTFPGSADPRQFPTHDEVRRYLAAYAAEFGLEPHIRFDSRVTQVRQEEASNGEAGAPPRWRVSTASSKSQAGAGVAKQEERQETFDAVVVCSGHFSQPKVPQLPGVESFPGQLFHSHNYRHASDFAGQRVVLLGAAASGSDIALELLGTAKWVYLSARSFSNPLTGEPQAAAVHSDDEAEHASTGAAQRHVTKVSCISALHPDGSVELADGTLLPNIDTVLLCTGYSYTYPFLEPGHVTVDDVRSELQARWIARSLSGRARALPSVEEMERDVQAFDAALEAEGIPPRFTHRCQGEYQWKLNRSYSEAAQGPIVGSWREEVFNATGKLRTDFPETYRNVGVGGGDKWALAAAVEAQALSEWEEGGRKPLGE